MIIQLFFFQNVTAKYILKPFPMHKRRQIEDQLAADHNMGTKSLRVFPHVPKHILGSKFSTTGAYKLPYLTKR